MEKHRFAPYVAVLLVAGTTLAPAAEGETSLSPAMRTRVDAAVKSVLDRTGVPSASIALVRGNEVVYANAYGYAQLEPKRNATPGMRYAVGSISKEFTAAALLL